MNKIEQSDNILNKVVILHDVEASPNGLIPNLMIEAAIKSFNEGKYYLEFISPVNLNGKEEKTAWISARHVELPISNVKKNGILAVNGECSSGGQFLARINLK